VLPRFFVCDVRDLSDISNVSDATGHRSFDDIALSEDESRHATSVLRLRVGDRVSVFDGRGREWEGRITSAGRSAVKVTLEREVSPAVEARVAVTLLQAVLKGDHMDAVVRVAPMLGVTRIRPILTARTVVSASAASGAGARMRWLRVAIASAKQCRRAVVPDITPAAPLETALADEATAECDVRVVLAEPAARAAEPRPTPALLPRSAVLAVGPEGGWAREELARFDAAGFVRLTLGSLTLRADAASMVAIGVLRERWGDW
jgi:16S rRNA (uracil1498-N3)-methyltransferase